MYSALASSKGARTGTCADGFPYPRPATDLQGTEYSTTAGTEANDSGATLHFAFCRLLFFILFSLLHFF